MSDLGQPSSYLALEDGASVYSCDGETVGKVEHVLAEFGVDIFEGIVLDTSILPGSHRFVDAELVEEIFERGVLLKIDAAAAAELPKPEAGAAAMKADPAEGGESPLQDKLHRAWDLLSGKKPD
ncbi:MAG: PRC-barrel domain-containing protein [Solirubrobacterales bacterium]